MLTAAMVKALNGQIREEYYSSYLYLAMAAYCEEKNLKGFGHWMKLQSAEELGHAMKLFDYLLANGKKIQLEAIQAPPLEYGTTIEMFKQVLKHEQHITSCIHKLCDQAVSEKDYRTQVMLNWFVSEQQEEEENATEILTKLEAVEDRMSSVLWIDKELKKRGPES